MNNIYNFYSHGKLLITGEYLVLLGAKALAIPVKFGQSLRVSEIPELSTLVWNARERGKTWFTAELSINELKIISSSDYEIASRLQYLLRSCRDLNSKFLKVAVQVDTDTNFPRLWGLGTSSTLTANMAAWAEIDPFQLHWKVSQGSGYDIACAASSSPIIYQVAGGIPSVKHIAFSPPFVDHLCFVYLDKKQDSAKSLDDFIHNDNSPKDAIRQISEITETISKAMDFSLFIKLLDRHETILSAILRQPTVKQTLFPDFPGVVKSLGAWGGDFVMAASLSSENDVVAYFNSQGFRTILKYSEMVYSLAS